MNLLVASCGFWCCGSLTYCHFPSFQDKNLTFTEIRNHTLVKEFILLGIPRTQGQEVVLFVVFFIFYACTLLGNLLILLAVVSDSRFHTPMYFFLCNLSVLDIGFSSVSTPKMLANLLVKSRVISLGGCMSQVFFYHFLGCMESLLYTVMAYDRFAAICHPLRYAIIMNRRACVLLVAGGRGARGASAPAPARSWLHPPPWGSASPSWTGQGLRSDPHRPRELRAHARRPHS